MRPFFAAVLLAVALVVAGLIGHWQGPRTDTRAYLRPLRVSEAALLLEQREAVLLPGSVDAVVMTSRQVFPARAADPPELVVARQGEAFWLEPLARGRAYVRHVLPREALSAAMGGKDLNGYEAPEIAAVEPVLATDLLWLYALFETSLLVATMTALYGVVRLVWSRWLLAPGIVLTLALFLAGVRFYAPGFFALDRLGHRLVVDTIAAGLLVAAVPASVVAALSLLGWLATLTTRLAGRHVRALNFAAAQRYAAWLAIAAVGAWALAQYGLVSGRAAQVAATMARSVEWPETEAFRDELRGLKGADGERRALAVAELPPFTKAFVERTLATLPRAPAEARLFVRIDEHSALCIERGTTGALVDTRPLPPTGPLRRLLDAGGGFGSGAPAYFADLILRGRARLVAGRAVPDGRGRQAGAVYVEEQTGLRIW